MTYELVHDGVVRTFDVHVPWGWAYWHQRAYDEDGRVGFPLVIALQGGCRTPTTSQRAGTS